MKRGLIVATAVLGAFAVATVVTRSLSDEETRAKIRKAGDELLNIVDMVRDHQQVTAQAKQDQAEEEIRRNQAWADQQWEALGI